MNIKEISKEIHDVNVEKGFWDEKRNIGELLMLVTSELGEALEADRKGMKAEIENYNIITDAEGGFSSYAFRNCIKDSFEDEIADAVIRLFDLATGLGIDLEFHIQQKLNYNKTRPKKHGKLY